MSVTFTNIPPLVGLWGGAWMKPRVEALLSSVNSCYRIPEDRDKKKSTKKKKQQLNCCGFTWLFASAVISRTTNKKETKIEKRNKIQDKPYIAVKTSCQKHGGTDGDKDGAFLPAFDETDDVAGDESGDVLDDGASLVAQACLDLYHVSGNERWRRRRRSVEDNDDDEMNDEIG